MQRARAISCAVLVVVRTFTSHALMEEPVQEGATVVAEGGAGVRVHLKLVLAAWVLEERERERNRTETCYTLLVRGGGGGF